MRISAKNLRKSYRDAQRELIVLQGLNFEFAAGGSTAIVGRSGIGKSTLLHLLGCLDRPSAGTLYFDDLEVTALSEDALTDLRGKRVGFIFQFHHLLQEFSALENVAMPLLVAGIDEHEARSAAQELLEQVGLAERAAHRPGELSGGEQQRVSVARSLVRRPELILADEPTGNLDLESARAIQKLLVGLNKEHGSTLIVATHNMELAQSLDQVLQMQPGGALAPPT